MQPSKRRECSNAFAPPPFDPDRTRASLWPPYEIPMRHHITQRLAQQLPERKMCSLCTARLTTLNIIRVTQLMKPCALAQSRHCPRARLSCVRWFCLLCYAC